MNPEAIEAAVNAIREQEKFGTVPHSVMARVAIKAAAPYLIREARAAELEAAAEAALSTPLARDEFEDWLYNRAAAIRAEQ